MYKNYLQWREDSGSREALEEASSEVQDKLFISLGGLDAKTGDQLVLIEGARYDLNVEPQAYAAHVCYTLDSVLLPSSATRLVVLIDVRAGSDWPNPSASRLVPFVRKCANLLQESYPERLRKIIVYPLPFWLYHLGELILALLDAKTRDKVVLLGSANTEAGDSFAPQANCSEPAPTAQIAENFDNLDKTLPDHAHARHGTGPYNKKLLLDIGGEDSPVVF